MKIKELKQLSPDELMQKEQSIKKELFDLQYQLKFGSVEKPGRIQSLKKDIAKIQTLLNETTSDGAKTK